MTRQNPVISPSLRADMENVIATGTTTFLTNFTRDLFPDYAAPQAQDCVVGGLAQAVARYQQVTNRPIAQALALALIDIAKD